MSFLGIQFAGDDDGDNHSKMVDNIPRNSSIQSQNSAVLEGGSFRINTEMDGEREMSQDEVNRLVHDALRRARKATTDKRKTPLSPLSITSSRSGLSSMGESPHMPLDSKSRASEQQHFAPSNHLDQLVLSNSPDRGHNNEHVHALLSPTMDSLAEDGGSIRHVESIMSTNSSDSVLRKVEEEIVNARKAALESTQKSKHFATPQGSMDDVDGDAVLLSPHPERDNLADILDDQFRDDENLHNILDTDDSEDQFDEAMHDMGSEFALGTPTKDVFTRCLTVTSPVDSDTSAAAPLQFGYQPEPGAAEAKLAEEEIYESFEMSLDQLQQDQLAAVGPVNKAVAAEPPAHHQQPVMQSASQDSPRQQQQQQPPKVKPAVMQHDTPIHDNYAYVEEEEGVEAIDHVLQNMPSIGDEFDVKKMDYPSFCSKMALPVSQAKLTSSQVKSPMSETKSAMSQATSLANQAKFPLAKGGHAESFDEKSASFPTAHFEEGKAASVAAVLVEDESIEVKPPSSDTNGIVSPSDSDFTEVTVTEDEIAQIGSTVVMSSETSDCIKEEIIEDGDSEYTEETVEEEDENIEKQEDPSAREITIEGVLEIVSPEKASPLKLSPLKASPRRQSPQKLSPRKTSPQKSMAVPESKSESSDPLEPQEKENTPAKEEKPAMEESRSKLSKAAVAASNVFKAKPTSLAVDTSKNKIKFRHPYPYPSPLPKPRPASVIMNENETGNPDQFTSWSQARPELEKLLLAACGDSLARRSNACGALKVLSQKKKNQLALVRTKGFLDSIVFAVCATIPNNHDTEIALDARGRAVSTLLNVAVPKDNRSLVLVHPGVVECILKVIEDDQGEARVQACATLATLAKTPGNRGCMAKKDRLLDVLASVLMGSMDEEDFESSMDEDEEKKEEDESAEFGDEEENTSAEGFGSTSFSTNNTDGEIGTHFDDDGMSLGVSSSMSSIQPPGKGRSNHKSIRSQKDELHEQYSKQARLNACAALMHLTKQCAISVLVADNDSVVVSLVMVGRESDNLIHTKCIEMICNLSRFPANIAKLARNNALIDTLVKGGKSKNLDDRIWAMRSLQNITSDSTSKVVLANSRILTLLSICSMRKDYEEQVAAVAALYNLSTEPGAVVPLTNTRNVVATLVHLAHNAVSTPEIRKMACDALATIGLWLQTLAGSGSVPTGVASVPLPSHQTTGWQLWDRDQ